jgi:hypothetical protein
MRSVVKRKPSLFLHIPCIESPAKYVAEKYEVDKLNWKIAEGSG